MNGPAWSVIVPTYNRPQQLARCLNALTRLDPPAGGFEVIVVNDGGADFDDSLRRAIETDAATPVRLISQRNAGPGVARNAGAAVAHGTWLAFTDDDCEPQPNWLRAFEHALSAQPAALAGGTIRNSIRNNVFSETSQVLVGFISEWFDGTRRERMFTSNNIALARSEFIECGGFDPNFGIPAAEDREFCDRWFAQGRPSVSVADALVNHAHHLSLASFLKQHFSYGRAGIHFRRKRQAGRRPVPIDTISTWRRCFTPPAASR